MKIGTIAKTLVGAVGTVVTALAAAVADDVLDVSEGTGLASTLVLAAATVYGVWRVPNAPDEPVAKSRAAMLRCCGRSTTPPSSAASPRRRLARSAAATPILCRLRGARVAE
ncbi:hypothetical protein [Prauserella cavernicola]|uniref:Holin n=1 Tax=Prauserella cavernicola TaxID=2800127 RepID=A0A934QS05_9PSEU|nr:hypothetical protein [Prauserella cavernicola]MBK1785146.1 hypothetical protein [Prauserella cavernicola]